MGGREGAAQRREFEAVDQRVELGDRRRCQGVYALGRGATALGGKARGRDANRQVSIVANGRLARLVVEGEVTVVGAERDVYPVGERRQREGEGDLVLVRRAMRVSEGGVADSQRDARVGGRGGGRAGDRLIPHAWLHRDAAEQSPGGKGRPRGADAVKLRRRDREPAALPRIAQRASPPRLVAPEGPRRAVKLRGRRLREGSRARIGRDRWQRRCVAPHVNDAREHADHDEDDEPDEGDGHRETDGAQELLHPASLPRRATGVPFRTGAMVRPRALHRTPRPCAYRASGSASHSLSASGVKSSTTSPRRSGPTRSKRPRREACSASVSGRPRRRVTCRRMG